LPKRIRIAIADDHPLVRDGILYSLQAARDFEVVGQGASADEALRLARDTGPDLILLDISMPGGGLNAARAIAAACPEVKIVVLTVSKDDADVLAALKAGARGYILKGVTAQELVRILRDVESGESYVTPTLALQLLQAMTGPAGAPPRTAETPLDQLTERERQVLELIAEGMSNKEIGRQLSLTEKTVKHYVGNVLAKLQARNRVEAAMLAERVSRGEGAR
jgi:DNA-binding NarL/FixJ family response regulator